MAENDTNIEYNLTNSTSDYSINTTDYSNYTTDYSVDIAQNVSSIALSTEPDSPQDDGLSRIIRVYCIPISLCLGILGLILTLIVLSKKQLNSSTNVILKALTASDLLFQLLLLSHILITQIDLDQKSVSFYRMLLYSRIVPYFIYVPVMMSIYCVVVLSVQRYIAICKPFHARLLFSLPKARIIVVLIAIFSIACQIPHFFKFELQHSNTILPDNKTVYYWEKTALMTNCYYRRIISWVVDIILICIIPFITLVIINILLIREVHQSTKYMRLHLQRKPSRQSASIAREEQRITSLHIAIIIVFAICQSPYVAFNALKSNRCGNAPPPVSPAYNLTKDIGVFMCTLRSNIFFILYCWFSEQFWTSFNDIGRAIRQCGTRHCCTSHPRLTRGSANEYMLRPQSNIIRQDTARSLLNNNIDHNLLNNNIDHI